MYQVALTNEQMQLTFLVKQVLQGEEVIITDENGFRFKLISLLPQKINEGKPKTMRQLTLDQTLGFETLAGFL